MLSFSMILESLVWCSVIVLLQLLWFYTTMNGIENEMRHAKDKVALIEAIKACLLYYFFLWESTTAKPIPCDIIQTHYLILIPVTRPSQTKIQKSKPMRR